MKRSTGNSIEGRVYDGKGKLTGEARRTVVHPPPERDGRDEQTVRGIQQLIGRIRGILGQSPFPSRPSSDPRWS